MFISVYFRAHNVYFRAHNVYFMWDVGPLLYISCRSLAATIERMEKHKIVERKRREKTKELMTELQVTPYNSFRAVCTENGSSQGRNLAVTGLCVPSLLDCGSAARRPRSS